MEPTLDTQWTRTTQNIKIDSSAVKTTIYFNPDLVEPSMERGTSVLDIKSALAAKSYIEVEPSAAVMASEKAAIEYEHLKDHILNNVYSVAEYRNFCDTIGNRFIKTSSDKADAIIVAESHSYDNRLYGFIFLRFTSDKYMYVELICTNRRYKGVGVHLMAVLNQVCKDAGYYGIKLGATLNALGFYVKMGFDINTANSECPMVKYLACPPASVVLRGQKTINKYTDRLAEKCRISGGGKGKGRRRRTKNRRVRRRKSRKTQRFG